MSDHAAATHFLIWAPPPMSRWVLWDSRRAVAGHDPKWFDGPGLPRDAAPDVLGIWVAAEVSYPVTLAPPGRLNLLADRLVARWPYPYAPDYYVFPAGVRS